MKRLTAALLAVCLLMGALAGCSSKSATPREGLEDLISQMSEVKQGEMDVQISMKGIDAGETDHIALGVTGTYNTDAQEMEAAISLAVDQTTLTLTHMIMKGDTVYINAKELYNVLFSYMYAEYADYGIDVSAITDSVLGDATYLYYQESEDAGGSDESDNAEIIYTNLSAVLWNAVEDLDLVTENDGTYGIAFEGDNLKTLVRNLLDDVNVNLNGYTDAIWSYVEGALEAAGSTAGLEDISKDEFKTELQDLIDEALSSLDSSDSEELADTSVGVTFAYDKDAKTYTSTFDGKDGSSGTEINMTCTVKETEVAAVAVPADDDCITSEEMTANSESLYGDYNDGDYPSGEGVEAAETVTDIDYETVVNNDLATFLNQDLSSYASLSEKSLALPDGSTVQVPSIDADSSDLYGDDYLYCYTDGGLMQYLTSDESGEDLEALLTENIVYGINSALSYGSTYVSNSDLVINDDGTIGAMSFTYEDSGYGSVTEFYIAVKADGGSIVLLNVDIYHDYLDELDYAILDELGLLAGTSLSTFYDIGGGGKTV